MRLEEAVESLMYNIKHVVHIIINICIGFVSAAGIYYILLYYSTFGSTLSSAWAVFLGIYLAVGLTATSTQYVLLLWLTRGYDLNLERSEQGESS